MLAYFFTVESISKEEGLDSSKWREKYEHRNPRIDDKYQCSVPKWEGPEVSLSVEKVCQILSHLVPYLNCQEREQELNDCEQPRLMWDPSLDTSRNKKPGRAGYFSSKFIKPLKTVPTSPPFSHATGVNDFLTFTRTLTEQTPYEWDKV